MTQSKQTTKPRRYVRASPGPAQSLLRVVHSPDSPRIGSHFDVSPPGSTWSFGRSGPNAIADERLSREHCRVTHLDHGLVVEDLGSHNGTFVNGTRCEREFLFPGSVLRIGDTLLVLDAKPDADRSLAAGSPAPRVSPSSQAQELVGQSFAMQHVRRLVATVAPTAMTVLLLGPSGSGKEVAARALHAMSRRRGPFVAVNCGAIAAELADAELFGHRKGAFTGAGEARPGLLAEAQGGTLLLDEIGDLPPALQVKLLRAIEEKKVRAVGETATRDIDVRIVAATNVDLETKGFRQDLRARLAQWVIELPPLAERRADVLQLATHLMRRLDDAPVEPRWTPELAEALLLHDWPLNVRELENVVRQIVVAAGHLDTWDFDLLPIDLQQPIIARDASADPAGIPGRAQLLALLAEAHGNVRDVANKLGRDRKQVYRWLKRHGLSPDSYRQTSGD
jgi:DNA-binding NtrC family response regulator